MWYSFLGGGVKRANQAIQQHCVTFLTLKQQLQNHSNGTVSCIRVRGVSVTATQPSYHLFLHVSSVRR